MHYLISRKVSSALQDHRAVSHCLCSNTNKLLRYPTYTANVPMHEEKLVIYQINGGLSGITTQKPTITAPIARDLPAETGMARTKVGPMPFQNPLSPSDFHVCLKQSLIVEYLCSFPNLSDCIFDLTTSSG